MRGQRKPTGARNIRRWSRWLRLAMFLVFLGALWTGVYYAKDLKVFRLNEIVFQGNGHLKDGDLRKLMGLEGGEDLLLLSTDRLAFNLVSSPWVVDVRVRKEFPHRLLVRITEAEPAAVLQKRGKMFLVDRKGKVLERLNDKGDPFLPVIIDDEHSEKRTFEEALRLAGVVQELGLTAENKRIEITGLRGGPEDLGIRVEGMAIKLGEGGYREKLTRLFELSTEIQKRKINVESVDLRFANRVVVKPIKEVIR